MSVTKEQVQSAVQTIRAIADSIRELGEVPSGVLYASLMGVMTLDQYNMIIGILKSAGVVTESGHVLKWNVQHKSF